MIVALGLAAEDQVPRRVKTHSISRVELVALQRIVEADVKGVRHCFATSVRLGAATGSVHDA